MKKKIFCIFCIGVLTCLSITGCGSKNSGKETNDNKKSETEADDKSVPFTLTSIEWGNYEEKDLTGMEVIEFNVSGDDGDDYHRIIGEYNESYDTDYLGNLGIKSEDYDYDDSKILEKILEKFGRPNYIMEELAMGNFLDSDDDKELLEKAADSISDFEKIAQGDEGSLTYTLVYERETYTVAIMVLETKLYNDQASIMSLSNFEYFPTKESWEEYKVEHAESCAESDIDWVEWKEYQNYLK